MSARFCGTGSCVPDYVMDNDGVAKLVETSDSWIRERTGIARRHIAVKETTVSMANEAAKRALDNAGVLPEELDLILMSTISSDVIIPCGACEVQKAIGADKAVCFDLNGACTGFELSDKSHFLCMPMLYCMPVQTRYMLHLNQNRLL